MSNGDRKLREYVDWVGSLLGIWWIFVAASIISVFILGFSHTLLVLGLLGILVVIIVKTGKEKGLETFLNKAKENLVEWWDRKPGSDDD